MEPRRRGAIRRDGLPRLFRVRFTWADRQSSLGATARIRHSAPGRKQAFWSRLGISRRQPRLHRAVCMAALLPIIVLPIRHPSERHDLSTEMEAPTPHVACRTCLATPPTTHRPTHAPCLADATSSDVTIASRSDARAWPTIATGRRPSGRTPRRTAQRQRRSSRTPPNSPAP